MVRLFVFFGLASASYATVNLSTTTINTVTIAIAIAIAIITWVLQHKYCYYYTSPPKMLIKVAPEWSQ